ncbi:MAG: nitroreductase [Firmicutes bacterium]|nr:nitroreductase [Bacillota bacterium]
MIPVELYDYISKRKSVRQYDDRPLDIRAISEILEFVGKAEPLHKEIKKEIQVVSKDEINVFLPVRSPHYLMMTSEPREGYLENAGFLLQQIDLFLSSKGYGSCYVGMALPSKEARSMSELEYVIVLAFGRPAEPLHRTEPSEFKRKPLPEIADLSELMEDIDSFDAVTDIMDSVRLAPSATNGQPWYMVPDTGRLDFYCVKLGFIKSIGYRKMNRIDMGAALCHCSLAAEHAGIPSEFIFDSEAQKRCPKDYYYTGTILLNQAGTAR